MSAVPAMIGSQPLAYALAYARLGWHVMPLHSVRDGRCTCGRPHGKSPGECPTPGKHPAAATGQHESSADEATIREWWRRRPDANVGIHLAPSGLCAVDIDPRAGGDRGVLPYAADTALVAQTGGGGEHLLYRMPESYVMAATPGKGIDHKHNGYIVVEPSIHLTGRRYVWADWDVLSGEAPELRFAPSDVIRSEGERRAGESFGTQHATEQQVRELRATLATIDPDGSYEAWINVGLALASMTAHGFELWDEWSQRGQKYSGHRMADKWNTFRNTHSSFLWIFKNAQALGGHNVVQATSADPMQAPVPARRQAYVVDTPSELMTRPDPRWLIRGLLPDRGLAVIYGESGCGKSFAVVDLMAAIARGQRWNGRRVRRGVVVYVGLEGTTKRRLWAYMRHHGVTDVEMDDFLVVDGQSVNLLTSEVDADALVEAVRAKTDRPVLAVFFDTLNRVMPGGNENASEDMGLVVSRAQRVERALQCVVGFVHHSGKNAAAGARGHSSLKAACDLELEVIDSNGIRTITATKVKDGEGGQQFLFRLERVDLGPSTDPEADDDERIDSLVVVPVVGVEPAASRPDPLRLTRSEQDVWSAFCEASAQAPLTHGMRMDYAIKDMETASTLVEWRRAFDVRRPLTAPLGAERGKEMAARRTAWKDGHRGLIGKGWIRVNEHLGIVISASQPGERERE